MDEAYGETGQGLAQLGGEGLGGLRLQLVAVLDQGADPVGLAALAAGLADAGGDVRAALVGEGHGGDRRAAGRQLVDDADVEVGIERLRQRARDRRRREDQLVRRQPRRALVAQREPLLHAEAVLLVHRHKAEFGEHHTLLEQRVGADHHRDLADGDGRECGVLLRFLQLAGEKGDAQAERFQPAREVHGVLFGEQFGRRHQRALIAGARRGQQRGGGDHGLAGADVALHQPQHRPRLHQILRHLDQHPLLRASERERQLRLQRRLRLREGWQQRRRPALHLPAQQAHTQLVREQFLAAQAVLRGMGLGHQLAGVGVVGRLVDASQRGERVRHRQAGQGRQQDAVARGEIERLADQLAQRRLAQAGGERIDRRQRGFARQLLGALGDPVFRVHHLRAARAAAHPAVSAQPAARLHRAALLLVEVEEAQQQAAAGILDGHAQRAPLAGKADRGGGDAAENQRILAALELADGSRLAAVLVAQRQVEQQVLHGLDAEAVQHAAQVGTGAAQVLHLAGEPDRRCRLFRRWCHRGGVIRGPGCRRPRRAIRAAGWPRRWRHAPGRAAGSTGP